MKIQVRWLFLGVAVLLLVLPSPDRITRASEFDEGGNIEKFAVRRVQPPYPPNAERYRIQGVVTVQVTVDRDGQVVKAEFVRGNNVFRSVSLDAAKRWEFRSSATAELEGIIQFTFKLAD